MFKRILGGRTGDALVAALASCGYSNLGLSVTIPAFIRDKLSKRAGVKLIPLELSKLSVILKFRAAAGRWCPWHQHRANFAWQVSAHLT